MSAHTNQLNPAIPLHDNHMLIAKAVEHLTNAYSYLQKRMLDSPDDVLKINHQLIKDVTANNNHIIDMWVNVLHVSTPINHYHQPQIESYDIKMIFSNIFDSETMCQAMGIGINETVNEITQLPATNFKTTNLHNVYLKQYINWAHRCENEMVQTALNKDTACKLTLKISPTDNIATYELKDGDTHAH